MEQILKLGESTIVGRGWLKRRRIIFTGESSPGIYSFVAEWTSAHNSAAYNLYFSNSQREFNVLDGRITIVDVSKNEMRFRYEK